MANHHHHHQSQPQRHYYPRPFVVSPRGVHTHTLILLHGRGDSGPSFGSGFYVATPSSGFSLAALYPGLKFVFPTTALRYSSTHRMRLTEWFDIVSLTSPEEDGEKQREGLREAVDHVDALIALEVAHGIPEERIFLGGISQGCATALHVLLASGRRLGGFVGMSGWLPFAHDLRVICKMEATGTGPREAAGEGSGEESAEEHEDRDYVLPSDELPMHIDAVLYQQRGPTQQRVARPPRYPPAEPECQAAAMAFVRSNLELPEARAPEFPLLGLETPVFLAHGDVDGTVDYKLGRNMYSTLKHGLGMDVTWKRYKEFGHWYKVGSESSVCCEIVSNRREEGFTVFPSCRYQLMGD